MPCPCVAIDGPCDGTHFELASPYTYVYLQIREVPLPSDLPVDIWSTDCRFVPFDHATQYFFAGIDDAGNYNYKPAPPK